MGCLLALLAGFFPRFALVLLWIFTNEVDQAYDSFWVPLAGLIFLPLTTLVYALTWAPVVGPDGFDWFLIVLAFLLDLSSYAGGAEGARAASNASLALGVAVGGRARHHPSAEPRAARSFRSPQAAHARRRRGVGGRRAFAAQALAPSARSDSQRGVHGGAAGSPSSTACASSFGDSGGVGAPVMIMLIVGASSRTLASCLASEEPRMSTP